MTDDPIDFGSIDPTLPAEAFERRVAQVRFAATAVMARRRAGKATPLTQLFQWRAPLLAALVLITIVSVAAVRSERVDSGAEIELASDEVADALGTSSTMGTLLLSTSTSSADALLGEGVPQ